MAQDGSILRGVRVDKGRRTSVDDWTEDGVVIDRATVPASMSELPLAFGDRHASSSSDACHVVRVDLAELGLTRRQSAGAQTGRSHRPAAQYIQLVSSSAPYVRTVHTEMPTQNKQI